MSRRLSSSQSQRLTLAQPVVSGYPFTLTAWVRPAELASNASYRVLTLSQDVDGGSAFHSLCINALGSAVTYNHPCADTYLHPEGGFTYARSTATVRLHAWNHLAGVWRNPDDRQVFLQAGHRGLNTQPRSFGPMQRTTVGAIVRGPILNSSFEGLIAHAAAWREALEPHDLHRLAQGESPLRVRPWALAAYWPLAKDDLDGRGTPHPALFSINAPGWSISPPTRTRSLVRKLPLLPPLAAAAEQSISAACELIFAGIAGLRVTPAGRRLKHIDFETGDLSEFSSPPTVSAGATLEVTHEDAFPDRGGHAGRAHSLRVTFTAQATAANVEHTLPRGEPNCHVRTLIGHASVRSGGARLAAAFDESEHALWALRLDDSQTLSLLDPNGQALITQPLDALPWHCVEVATDDAGAVTLWIDGVHAGQASLPSAPALARVRWGLIAKDPLAQGEVHFDELVISTSPVGLVHPSPRADHAADPTRWLVLRRAGDPQSTAWALAYLQRRALPYSNLLAVNCPPDEIASPDTLQSLRAAITDHLAQHFPHHPPTGLLLGHRLPGYAQTQSGLRPLANLLCTQDAHHAGNPFFSPQGTADRPLASDLGRVHIAARIDGETLTDAMDWLDRADHASARTLESSDRIAILPENDPTLLAWSSSPSAQLCLLKLSHLDGPGIALEHDAFTWSSSATPPSWVGTDAARALLVAVNDFAPTLASARDPLMGSVGLAGIQAGYAAVLASCAVVPANDRPHPQPLLEALRKGWTLGEAWLLAQPRLDGPTYLLGDPLMSLRFPGPGWEWLEHAPHIAGTQGATERAACPITQRTLDIPPPGAIQATSTRWLLRRIAPRSPGITQAPAASWQPGLDAPVVLIPSPVWPTRSNWAFRCGAEHVEPAIVFDRSPRSLNIEALRLEALSPDGVISTAREEAPATHRRVHEHRLPRMPGTRYRWVLLAKSGPCQEGPWSLPTPAHADPSLTIPFLE